MRFDQNTNFHDFSLVGRPINYDSWPISFNYSFKPYMKQNNIWYNGKISYGPSRTFYRHIPFCGAYAKQRMSAHGKRKKSRNSRWRNFSTLLTLQNWCILGNQTVSVKTN